MEKLNRLELIRACGEARIEPTKEEIKFLEELGTLKAQVDYLLDKYPQVSKKIEEIRQHYIRSSDPVQAFINDETLPDVEKFVSTQKLYNAFCKYCQKMKLPTARPQTFTRKLLEIAPNIQKIRRDVKGKRTRCWLGISMEDN